MEIPTLAVIALAVKRPTWRGKLAEPYLDGTGSVLSHELFLHRLVGVGSLKEFGINTHNGVYTFYVIAPESSGYDCKP